MTVCNMTIEAGGRSGMVAPDETTFEWVLGRPGAPPELPQEWAGLHTDPGAKFDKEVVVANHPLPPLGTHLFGGRARVGDVSEHQRDRTVRRAHPPDRGHHRLERRRDHVNRGELYPLFQESDRRPSAIAPAYLDASITSHQNRSLG